MPPIPVIAPMLVSSGRVPRDVVWELKWDGFRCCAVLDGEGAVRVATRTGRLVQDSLPELAPLATCGPAMVLDGELVAGNGMPSSFYCLAGRLSANRPETVARRMRIAPVTFVIFDLLWLDGRQLLDTLYSDRRARLEELRLRGPNWVTSPTYDDGDALLAAAAQLAAEGCVAKARGGRLGRYLPGARSPGWVKRKCPAWYREHAPRRRIGGWAGPA